MGQDFLDRQYLLYIVILVKFGNKKFLIIKGFCACDCLCLAGETEQGYSQDSHL